MLRLIPRPRTQEMLYSALARFGVQLGGVEAGRFMATLLGRRHAIASPDLPGGLAALVRELDPERREAAIDALIDRSTLLPFHTAFVPADLRSSVRQAMRGDVTGVYTRLGLATFRVRPPTRLRFCSACLDCMEAERGYAWWRRDHQLPGVPVCPEHGLPLLLSGVAPAVDRHAFVAATRAVCGADAEPAITAGEEELIGLHSLARAAAAMLDEPPPASGFDDLALGYRERLTDVGLMRSPKRVNHAGLREAFLAHWGRVPELLGLGLGDDVEASWLAAMVRAGRRAAPPVQHLLLRGMLDAMRAVPRELPFGAGPWPCCNPLAGHHGADAVTDLMVRRDRDILYGDFACSCGYLYTRSRGPDGIVGKPRYRSFGPLLQPALVAAVSRGDGLRATARALGLDPKTLMREAAMAGVTVPWTLSASGMVPAASSATPSTRPAKRRPAARVRRNWLAIDTRMARSARHAAAAILAQVPPARVTMAAIEARIARRDWIGKRMAKLPRTVAVIAGAVEDVDGFRVRRLRHQVGLALASGELRPCEVLRAAGLPTGWLAEVRGEIAAALVRGRLAA